MKILTIFIFVSINLVYCQDDPNEVLSVNVDGLLMNQAEITASSTCGMKGPEKYCRLVDEEYTMMEPGQGLNVLCDICDDRNDTKRHPIEYAKSDDHNLWWQSPSMAQGSEFQRVNITIDLKQVYQIVYILLKMADSPRPGTWVLEKSLDGSSYSPWIFFADTPYACFNLFQRRFPNIKLTTYAKPPSLEDDEVFCTTYYSQPNSLIAGEIIISLINGRKSLLRQDDLAPRSIPLKLINFLSARFIRFRFLKPLTLSADLMTYKGHLEKSIYNRYFYSLRNIEIGGKCICNNHADKCDKVVEDGIVVAKCNCKHFTCGNNCERCCPMFNQKPWRQGLVCEECNCNGKASKCVYNQTIATLQLSINKFKAVDGGGLCLDCRENTAGVNCDKCKEGYYRPWNVQATSSFPCKPCTCNGIGTIGTCISNGEETGNQKPGDCICKKGYNGAQCEKCDLGYERYPNMECLPCPCSIDGSVSTSMYRCKPPCNCKVNVEASSNCHKCKESFFNLEGINGEGCQPCYCFGITDRCSSLNAMNIKIKNLNNWKASTVSMNKKGDPRITSLQYPIIENSFIDPILGNPSGYYWEAPSEYLGNWLTSYKSLFQYVIKIDIEGTTIGSQIDSPDVIIKCGSIRISHSVSSDDKRLHRNVQIPVKEKLWNVFTSMGSTRVISKDEFMSCLIDIQAMLIKGKYFSNQISVGLLNVTLDRGEQSNALRNMPHIEKCECPPGYSGLSCESCQVGYRRVNDILVKGRCELCNCFQHSNSCDSVSGECKDCFHNTSGKSCETCSTGFYGYPRTGDPNSCKRCSCPLEDYQMTNSCSTFEPSKYFCNDCTGKTGGPYCQRCIDGYYGNPLKKIPCQKCKCNNNEESCDSVSGLCRCSFNTMGSSCEHCQDGFFGDALKRNCQSCQCSTIGSTSQFCDKTTKQCLCKANFSNRRCDTCAPGLFIKNGMCFPCSCNEAGRVSSRQFCDSSTGKCICRTGVTGKSCDICLAEYYGFPDCKKCGCSNHSISLNCDSIDGSCKCGTNVLDKKCENCLDYFYWTNRTDCSSCKCDLGSSKPQCDQGNGQCECSKHVLGRTCNKCESGYYGISSSGCKKCPECLNGKVCDNDGNCVCPSNTEGEYCERCSDQSWGYDKASGCKKCDCFDLGSKSSTCDSISGQCICHSNFQNKKCNECASNHFGFPKCRPCDCNKKGVLPDQMNTCDSVSGFCPCKLNVEGEKCDKCKNGTFGFNEDYKAGCFSCFCSGRSSQCSHLMDHRIISSAVYNYHIYNDVQTFSSGKNQRVIKLSQNMLPRFGWPLKLFRPVFVDVTEFLTTPDMSLLYQSVLLTAEIDCQNIKCGRENTQQTEVIIESHGGHIELNYIVKHSQTNNKKIIVDLSETSKHGQWFLIKYNNQTLPQPVYLGNNDFINLARDVFMLALLNVSKVSIQLYSSAVNPDDIIMELETFIPVQTKDNIGVVISSVEKCECDSTTTGLHCENPIYGYFKKSLPELFFNISVRIGQRINVDVKKCFCNGHSKECNKITGHCINCMDKTTGPKCELCVDGFYGEPTNNGQCFPCECPDKINNFAKKCKTSSTLVECECRNGYAGKRCEKCQPGYFRHPVNGIECMKCNCNTDGSLSLTCNGDGKCECAAGVTGDKCDQCSDNHVVENKTCKNCLTGCTKELFLRIIKLNNTMQNMKWKSFPSKGETLLKQIHLTVMSIKSNLIDTNEVYALSKEIEKVNNEFQTRKYNLIKKLNNAMIVRDVYNETFRKIFEIFKDIEETISGGKNAQVSKDVITNATNILREIKELKMKLPDMVYIEHELLLIQNHIDKINRNRKLMQSKTQLGQMVNLKELSMKTNLADLLNKENKEYLEKLNTEMLYYENKIKQYQQKANLKNEEFEEITLKKRTLHDEIDKLKQLSFEFDQKINKTLIIVFDIENILKKPWNSTPNFKKLIIPQSVREIVYKMVEKSKQLIKNLLQSFRILSKAENAKQAYTNISKHIVDVELAIKSTGQQLEDSKTQLNIEKFTINLNYIFKNHSQIVESEKTERNKFEELNVDYNLLKERNKQLENGNMERISKVRVTKYKDLKLYKNITSIENNQDINQNVINHLTKRLSSFQIPNSEDVEVMDIDKKVNDLRTQYKEIRNDTDSVIVSIKEFRENIQKLRERFNKRRLYMELAHGAASKSPEPIRLDKNCVRHYKTYFLPKSNAFYIELYLNPQFHSEQYIILLGYDNSGGGNKSFALTIEKNKQLTFWFDYGNGPNELNGDISTFTPYNYTGLSISWKLGKWEMKHKSLDEENESKFGAYSSNNMGINNIFLGPESHIFLGGYPSDMLLKKSNLTLGGLLVKKMKENYRTKYYKGCIYGVKVMHFDLGLQDFYNVEDECVNSRSPDFLLKQTFTCKISQSDTGKVENARNIIKRQKRNINTDYNLHFDGHGYVMINTSAVKQNGQTCSKLLNRALRIYTFPQSKINIQSFQLVAVFVNEKLNIGFALGQQNGMFHHAYWTEKNDFPIKTMNFTSEFIVWKAFEPINALIFGIKELCHPYSYMYIGGITLFDTKLREKLKRLEVPYYSFTGSVRIDVVGKDVFRESSTRFVSKKTKSEKEISISPFHSLLVPAGLSDVFSLDHDNYESVLKKGFSFNVNFMGTHIKDNLTLLTIESSFHTLSVRMSPDSVFTVFLNNEKLSIKNSNVVKKGGTYFVMVNIQIKSESTEIYLTVNELQFMMKEFPVKMDTKVTKIIIGQLGFPQPFYLYDIFLGERLVNFNAPQMRDLPMNVYLKLSQSPLYPKDISFGTSNPEISTMILRVSSRNRDIHQSDAIALPYINKAHLYSSSIIANKNILLSFQSKDYPLDSGWFDGLPGGMVSLKGDTINKYMTDNMKKISIRLSSHSNRPEMIFSINFNPSKTLNIVTMNMQVLLYDSLTKWNSSLRVPIVNKEWHLIELMASPNSKDGLLVTIDGHSFDFPNGPFSFTKPNLIEIGGYSGAKPIIFYNDKYQEIGMFTGCLDNLMINDKKVSLNIGSIGRIFNQCPRVLEFLDTGVEIMDSYAMVSSSADIIKLQIGNYSVKKKGNSLITEFRFKYTGFEQGGIFLTGEDSKYCAVVINDRKIYLNCKNFKNGFYKSESMNLMIDKWYKVEFLIFHMSNIISLFKVDVDDTDIQIYLSGQDTFSENFLKPDIYLGGHPNLNSDQKLSLMGTKRNFVGCLSSLKVRTNTNYIQSGFGRSQHIIPGRCSVDRLSHLRNI